MEVGMEMKNNEYYRDKNIHPNVHIGIKENEVALAVALADSWFATRGYKKAFRLCKDGLSVYWNPLLEVASHVLYNDELTYCDIDFVCDFILYREHDIIKLVSPIDNNIYTEL